MGIQTWDVHSSYFFLQLQLEAKVLGHPDPSRNRKKGAFKYSLDLWSCAS